MDAVWHMRVCAVNVCFLLKCPPSWFLLGISTTSWLGNLPQGELAQGGEIPKYTLSFLRHIAHTLLNLKARTHRTEKEKYCTRTQNWWSVLKSMALQNTAADEIDSLPVELCHSRGWLLTAMSAAEKYMSPKQVRWWTRSKVIIPFSDYLRKGLELTNYLMDEGGCFSPFIFPARALLKDLNYLPITAHFQGTGWGQDSKQLQLGSNNHVLGYWDHHILNNEKHLVPK